MKPKYAIVTDFDGTITTLDIGNTLAVRNGTITPEGVEEDYRNNADANSWMAYHFGLMQTTREEFESLVLSYAEIKPGFTELAAHARAHAIPMEIASGGLDIYINPVLKKGNVELPVYSVRGRFKDGTIAVDFPHFKGMKLHDFKASRVKYYKDKGYTVIFLGDGISDFPAAKLADIVFAADHLEKLCQTNKVKYYEFKDFKNTLKILKGEHVPVS